MLEKFTADKNQEQCINIFKIKVKDRQQDFETH